jgi:hypothetical protein
VANKFTDEDDALLEELGVEVEAKKEAGRTAREERVIAGFEEIQRFVDQHGHAPQHGEDRDIFERLPRNHRVYSHYAGQFYQKDIFGGLDHRAATTRS